jgi:multidrug efflux pump subunit AcrA (membrane-fusion protein)
MRTAFTPRRVLILVLTLAGLVIASLAAIHLNTGNLPAPKAAGGPVVVDTAVSRVATIQDAVTAIGTLRAAESVVVKSEISGRVARISFSDGARVMPAFSRRKCSRPVPSVT